MVNTVRLVNRTKQILSVSTKLAITSKPKVQIAQNKNLVEVKYMLFNIVVTLYQLLLPPSCKKMSENVALLLTHPVYAAYSGI